MKVLISIFLFCTINFGFVTEDEKIPWREGERLTWDMFKGHPESIQGFVASTNSGISLSFGVKRSGTKVDVNYTVQSYFYPNNSWYRKGNVNAFVLAHEQTHFDISELFARKLRQKFDAIPKTLDFQKRAEVVYKKNEQDRVEMQDRFDSETDHSRIKEQERKWETFVAEQLEVYNDWK